MPTVDRGLRRQISVRLTERQWHALTSYANAVDSPRGALVRAIVLQTIPPRYWEREEPPPGQMKLGDAP